MLRLQLTESIFEISRRHFDPKNAFFGPIFLECFSISTFLVFWSKRTGQLENIFQNNFGAHFEALRAHAQIWQSNQIIKRNEKKNPNFDHMSQIWYQIGLIFHAWTDASVLKLLRPIFQAILMYARVKKMHFFTLFGRFGSLLLHFWPKKNSDSKWQPAAFCFICFFCWFSSLDLAVFCFF